MHDLRLVAFDRHRLVKVDRDEMLLLGERISVRDRRLGFFALQLLGCLHGLANDCLRWLVAWEVTHGLPEFCIVIHDATCSMIQSKHQCQSSIVQ